MKKKFPFSSSSASESKGKKQRCSSISTVEFGLETNSSLTDGTGIQWSQSDE